MRNKLLLTLIILSADIAAHAAAYCPELPAIGIQLVKQFEGFSAVPYRDAGAWAIGYGSRGPFIKPGIVWTEAAASAVLHLDLKITAKEICRQLPNTRLTANQLAALTSFAYNVGIGRLMKSGILKLVEAGKLDVAVRKFGLYIRSQGVVLKGLIRRRHAEQVLFQLNSRGN